MNFGSKRMQAHRQGFVLLVGNQIDFGAEQLANEREPEQGTGQIAAARASGRSKDHKRPV
jgi:hypothetical protein